MEGKEKDLVRGEGGKEGRILGERSGGDFGTTDYTQDSENHNQGPSTRLPE